MRHHTLVVCMLYLAFMVATGLHDETKPVVNLLDDVEMLDVDLTGGSDGFAPAPSPPEKKAPGMDPNAKAVPPTKKSGEIKRLLHQKKRW